MLSFPTGSAIKNVPAVQEPRETRFWSLGWEGPLEKSVATHSSILAWRIPWTEEPGGLQSIVSQSRTWLKGLSTACRYNEYTSWDCLKALLFCGLDQTNQLDFHGFLPGGRDTAGLGGKGGPYRLDAGHTVYQVSQAEKDAVPEEVKRAAREMGQRAFQQRWVVPTVSGAGKRHGKPWADPGFCESLLHAAT